MKIRSEGAELFHVDRQTDGRTDMKKLIVTLNNFENLPKMI
jgi:Fe-S-cluster formation regulator IscX/YfhJ